MKASLQFRLSQHLAMTPQLQQSIRLLQLSALELNQEIEQALADNPLLERVDDPQNTTLRVASDGSIQQTTSGTPEAAEADAVESESSAGLDWDPEYGHRSDGRDTDRDDSAQHWAASPLTLAAHLRTQLAGTRAQPQDRALIELLIEALDENGYLTASLEELLALLPPDAAIELDELSAALRLLQSFDPTGVGARNVAECLSLQVTALAHDEDDPLDPVLARLAQKIISEHLQLLADRDFKKLQRILNIGDDELRAIHRLILGLSPRPGVGYGQAGAEYIVPDVMVRRKGSRWMAQLNTEVMPRLRVNAAYAAEVRRANRAQAAKHSKTSSDETQNDAPNWTGRLQDARWLIRNLQQRFDTITRVAQAIVDRQQRFFDHGDIAMRPLVLREIADTVGLHESTISRVTNGKYMATPFGVLEFKYFFASGVATESGGAASSTAIRALIQQLVDAEDSKAPLSDSQIATLLGQQGVVCARRTVAKYRELLQIPPVTQRRSL